MEFRYLKSQQISMGHAWGWRTRDDVGKFTARSAISENRLDMYELTEQQLNDIGSHHNSQLQRVFQAASCNSHASWQFLRTQSMRLTNFASIQ